MPWRGWAYNGPVPDLRAYDSFVIDLDGVVYRGRALCRGAGEFLAYLRKRRQRFIFLTNNSRLTPERVAAHLRTLGVAAEAEDVLTAGQATARYLEELPVQGEGRAMVVGSAGLAELVEGAGWKVVTERPHQVVVGLDTKFSYEAISKASRAILSGAGFVAVNYDRTVPVEEGPLPGAGAMVAAIHYTTDVAPTVVGKPEVRMLRYAIAALGSQPERTLLIGDALDIDIRMARDAGVASALVLSGVSTQADVRNSPHQPTFIFEDLGALLRVLGSLL